MKHLLISRADGGLSIMPDIKESHADIEVKKWEGVASSEWLPIKGYRLVDDLPSIDRTFRNALIDDGTSITHDMPKARDIWRDKIREARAPLLEDLDVEYIRSLEQGQVTTTIVDQKQSLRDAPADPAIEAAQTPEELKAIWPVELKNNIKDLNG